MQAALRQRCIKWLADGELLGRRYQRAIGAAGDHCEAAPERGQRADALQRAGRAFDACDMARQTRLQRELQPSFEFVEALAVVRQARARMRLLQPAHQCREARVLVLQLAPPNSWPPTAARG